MAAFLRLTPEEYRAVAAAYPPLRSARGYRALRTRLAGALREGRPDLARRVAGLSTRQVGLLRDHLEGRRSWVRPATQENLTWREWQEVAHAGDAFCLLDGGLGGFKDFLLRYLGESSSPLASKLARLEDTQVTRLYLAVRSGRRCCL